MKRPTRRARVDLSLPLSLERKSPGFRRFYAAYLGGARVLIVLAAGVALIILPINLVRLVRAGDDFAALGVAAMAPVYLGGCWFLYRFLGRWRRELLEPR